MINPTPLPLPEAKITLRGVLLWIVLIALTIAKEWFP